jgi:tRNA(Arg) A34 adenosine deaminase TadA
MMNTNASEPDKYFMRRAIDLSLHAMEKNDGNPFGSVVVRGGAVIGEGWNKIRSSNDPSAHAEMEAIRDACRRISSPRLDGCVIYASGQPCPMCLALIYLTGIEKVFFCIPGEKMASLNPALSVQRVYEAIATPQSERSIPEVQIMPEEIETLMNRYKEG